MKHQEDFEEIQKQLSQPNLEQKSTNTQNKDALVQRILKEHQQNMTKNAPKAVKPIGPISLVAKPIVAG